LREIKNEKERKDFLFFHFLFLASLYEIHKYVPYGDDMAEGPHEDEEMEHGVHVFALVQGIENRPGDVADTFGYDPGDGSGTCRIQQRLEGKDDRKAHADEAEGFEIAVILEFTERGEGAGNGARPYEDEHPPS